MICYLHCNQKVGLVAKISGLIKLDYKTAKDLKKYFGNLFFPYQVNVYDITSLDDYL